MIKIERDEIEKLFDRSIARAALVDAFIKYVNGETIVPQHAYLEFSKPKAECHVKTGYIKGTEAYVVKVSNGFYENPAKGLPSSTGAVSLFSSETGEPLACLVDLGFLTDIRTAITGAIATKLLAVSRPEKIGIIGTGVQARLQLQEILAEYCHHPQVAVWGRNKEGVKAFQEHFAARQIEVEAAPSLEDLCSTSNVIVTTTPSREPLVYSDWIRPGTHITAVGSDSRGKQELEEKLVARAAIILADSCKNSRNNGEVAAVLQSGLDFSMLNVVELGDALQKGVQREASDITIADLTGIAIQDAAVALAVWRAYQAR